MSADLDANCSRCGARRWMPKHYVSLQTMTVSPQWECATCGFMQHGEELRIVEKGTS